MDEYKTPYNKLIFLLLMLLLIFLFVERKTMSLFSARPLTQNQEVTNITVDDDLTVTCTFTTLDATTGNITNCNDECELYDYFT